MIPSLDKAAVRLTDEEARPDGDGESARVGNDVGGGLGGKFTRSELSMTYLLGVARARLQVVAGLGHEVWLGGAAEIMPTLHGPTKTQLSWIRDMDTCWTGDLVVKDSRRKSIHVMYLLGFSGLGYCVQHFLFPGTLETIFAVTAWIFIVMIWVLLFMPTYCDYDVGGRGCSREVYGKVRGCFQHRRLKRDAIWAAMGKRNPGLAFRLTWGNSRPQPGHQLGLDPGMSDRAAQQGLYNASMWAFAAVSALVGVITLLLAILWR